MLRTRRLSIARPGVGARSEHGVSTSETRPYAELQGLGRALAVLEVLAEQPLRAKELADRLGLKWTTAYRTLAFLADTGYVRRDDATGMYTIGVRLYSIGSSYAAHLPLAQAARPTLRAAADETRATAQLVERDGFRSVVVAVAEPASETIPKASMGFHFPLHCGSKGQVLLAYAGDDVVAEYLGRPLQRLTQHTIVDPVELRAKLAAVREQGYAVTRRDVQLSTGSVAAPVHDAAGNVVAATCLIASATDVDANESRLVEAVLDAARSLSTFLGWRPTVRGPV
jgi:DNA-binding IclR family transcriptional regulator